MNYNKLEVQAGPLNVTNRWNITKHIVQEVMRERVTAARHDEYKITHQIIDDMWGEMIHLEYQLVQNGVVMTRSYITGSLVVDQKKTNPVRPAHSVFSNDECTTFTIDFANDRPNKALSPYLSSSRGSELSLEPGNCRGVPYGYANHYVLRGEQVIADALLFTEDSKHILNDAKTLTEEVWRGTLSCKKVADLVKAWPGVLDFIETRDKPTTTALQCSTEKLAELITKVQKVP